MESIRKLGVEKHPINQGQLKLKGHDARNTVTWVAAELVPLTTLQQHMLEQPIKAR
jgi:hypothetical protein